MQGLLGMMEELSASQKKKVSSFKMYYQYAVDTEYVYHTDEHILVLHSMGMYHSASKWRQTGHVSMSTALCVMKSLKSYGWAFFPCAFKTMNETCDKNISIYLSPLRCCDAFSMLWTIWSVLYVLFCFSPPSLDRNKIRNSLQ